MKPETLLDAMSYIDEDLLARAEAPETKKIRWFPRRLAAVAACLTLILGATALATGVLDPLLAYFGGDTQPYLEEILISGPTVSGDTLEMRIEGAIADSRTAYLVVSFTGLDQETSRALRKGGLDVRPDLVYTAMTSDGEAIPFANTTIGTYTDGGSRPISQFEDVDLTYIFFGVLPENLSMEDMTQVCLTYEDLPLEVPVQDYLCPEYALEPEREGLPEVYHLRMSAVGFSYTTTDPDLYLDLKPIYADGTVYETFGEDFGISSGGDGQTVSGHWCSGSPLALTVLDLADYRGLQVNGVNYYFVEE